MRNLNKRIADLERGNLTTEEQRQNLLWLCLPDCSAEVHRNLPCLDDVIAFSYEARKKTGETSTATVVEYEAELIKTIPGTGSELMLMMLDRYAKGATEEKIQR